MTESITTTEADSESADIALAALTCQARYRYWIQASSPELRSALQQAHRDAAEHLLSLLWASLIGVARGWLRSGLTSDVDSLAMNLFASILLELPRLEIDPRRNVRALLLQVARRRVYDQHRIEIMDGRRRPAYERDTAGQAYQSFDASEHADRDSYDAEESVIRMLDNARYLRVIFMFWKRELSSEDRMIVELRLQERSFQEIAGMLAASPAAMRQRHHRIIERTRAYLRKHGLLDVDA